MDDTDDRFFDFSDFRFPILTCTNVEIVSRFLCDGID